MFTSGRSFQIKDVIIDVWVQLPVYIFKLQKKIMAQ